MPSHYLTAQVLGAAPSPPEGQRRLGLFRQPRPQPAIEQPDTDTVLDQLEDRLERQYPTQFSMPEGTLWVDTLRGSTRGSTALVPDKTKATGYRTLQNPTFRPAIRRNQAMQSEILARLAPAMLQEDRLRYEQSLAIDPERQRQKARLDVILTDPKTDPQHKLFSIDREFRPQQRPQPGIEGNLPQRPQPGLQQAPSLDDGDVAGAAAAVQPPVAEETMPLDLTLLDLGVDPEIVDLAETNPSPEELVRAILEAHGEQFLVENFNQLWPAIVRGLGRKNVMSSVSGSFGEAVRGGLFGFETTGDTVRDLIRRELVKRGFSLLGGEPYDPDVHWPAPPQKWEPPRSRQPAIQGRRPRRQPAIQHDEATQFFQAGP